MADTKLTGLTATTTPVLTDYGYVVTTPGGTPASHYATLDVLQQILSIKNVADGRLTLTTATPVTTADVSAATTLYYALYTGNKIGLYDGTSWHVRTFTELSITNAGLAASKPYDVFCYDNSGTPTLELLVWTNDTTRGTALARQDGVLVKTGAATRRYLGTVYSDSASKFNDVGSGGHASAAATRGVWNYYNRKLRSAYIDDQNSHAYNSTARAYDNDNNNRLNFVVGVIEDAIFAQIAYASIICGASATGLVGFGLDSTSVFLDRYFVRSVANGANIGAGGGGQLQLSDVSAGFHYFQMLQSGNAGNATFDEARMSVGIWG